jgi:type IV pilus assembly protein PilP
MRPKTFKTALPLIVLSILMIGCNGDDRFKDLTEYLDKVQQQEQNMRKKNKMEEIKPPSTVTYEADQLREPFSGNELLADGKAKRVVNSANPLLAYPINVLRLVGTVSHGTERIAYIMDPSNMVYHIKIGDFIGEHNGRVISIMPDRISVMEEFSEDGKAVSQHVSVIKLQGGS